MSALKPIVLSTITSMALGARLRRDETFCGRLGAGLARFVAAVLLAAWPAASLSADEDFEKHVRPLLLERCVQCHGADKQSGGLRLDSREALLKGGYSGPAAVSGKPDESLLITAVEYKDDVRMPPKGKLQDDDISRLKAWVQRGLPWPASSPRPTEPPLSNRLTGGESRAWWSFQPLRPVAPPDVNDKAWSKTEIDRFILAALEAKGLTPAPPADKRTLLRRATYDLTGLPPTPEEVEAFLGDPRSDAFALVVERLLASPAYGERWGRHWLDVVRYADTAGENTDHPVPDAWRYRNWVIDAFNHDQPYDEFVREQVAGDILAARGPEDRYSSRLIATGFLAIARRFDHDSDKHMHLTYEDTIDALGKSFLGLSISCARCHDHKYDPISAEDYYALYGILQSSRYAFPGCEAKQQPRDLSPLQSPAAIARRAARDAEELAALEAEAKQIAAARAALTARNSQTSPTTVSAGEISDGGTQPLAAADGAPLGPIAVRAGEVIRLSVAPLGNHGADTTLVEWEIAEVDGERRWSLAADVIDDFPASNPRSDGYDNPSVWCYLDGRAGFRLFTNVQREVQGKPGLHLWGNADTPSVFVNADEKPVQVWTLLPPRSVFVHPAPDGPVAIAWVSPITGKIRIQGRITDAHPGGPNGVGWSVEHVAQNVLADLREFAALEARTAEIERRRSELNRQETVYAVVEGQIGNARLHLRGDPEKLGPEVPRRWLDVLGGERVPDNGGSGRLQLAGWLTDENNPLTARVMANRIWQHHFGKGLVKTPNDFGVRGERPTHPELLDWLARQFIEDGWSIKASHRRIMLSATYQQAVAVRPEAADLDPNNDLYWRFDRRRLSAEELRDSLLALSGQLDRTPGGPHPFPPQDTWGFTQHNPFNSIYETDKRSVYLVTLRNRRNPFFALFDGADPNATTPQRQVTTVPTQALFFLNDPFFHAQAERIAVRLLANPDDAERLNSAYRDILQRAPTARERDRATELLQTYRESLSDTPPADRPRAAWSALVRVLLAGNEFLFLE